MTYYTLPAEVEAVEDEFNNYYNENFGPFWGEQNRREVYEIESRLFCLYEKHETPIDERLAGFESAPSLPSWMEKI
jgi:hypothetical protein